MSIATRAVTFLMTLVALAMVIAMLTDGRLRRADVPVVAMPSDEAIQAINERNAMEQDHHRFRCPSSYARR